MSNTEKANWKRDALIIPLVVGLIIAVATYFIPKLLDKGKQLTYQIESPAAYVNTTAVKGVSITLNGVQVKNLFGYRIRLWNSGSSSLHDVPVQFRFESQSADFKILSTDHATVPAQEFGRIDEQGIEGTAKRFVYELLNPKDEDIVTFVTNESAPIRVYAKSEDLHVVQQFNKSTSLFGTNKWAPIGLAVVASLLTVGFKELSGLIYARIHHSRSQGNMTEIERDAKIN